MSARMTISAILIAGVLLAGSMVWAKGPPGVSNTIHNFSTTSPSEFGQYASDNETAVCIFCHTPHGASNNGPLWNHPFDDGSTDIAAAGYFTHYNSATLTTGAAGTPGYNTTRVLNNESLLCMSCHDGSIAVNRLINYSNTHGQDTMGGGNPDVFIQGDVTFGLERNIARIGSNNADWWGTADLTDDHPVSFSYSAAEAEETFNMEYGLKTVAEAEAAGVRFFGTDDRVECSTCHDPHVDYIANAQYNPFLITSNRGSALCFACHNK